MGGSPDIPQQNLGEELSSILSFMPKFVQKSFGLTGQYAPKFAEQDIKNISQFAPQYAQKGLDITKQFAPQYAGAGFDITKQYAPQYAGLGFDITKQFAPQYAGLGLDISKQYAPEYLGLNLSQLQKSIAGQPLLSELNKQAQSELALKGMPSEDELRRASQQTLAGFAARGNVLGNQSLAADVLSRDELVHQRAREAQQFAAGVQGLDVSQLQGLGGVVQTPNLPGYAPPPNLAAYGAAPNLAGYAAPPNLPAYAAPGASTQPMGQALGALQGVTSTLFPFASDVFSSNQSAAAQQNIAASNKAGAGAGAGIGALGAIIPAVIGL